MGSRGMTREDKVLLAGVAAVLLTVAAGCGDGGGITGPSEVGQNAQEAVGAPLAVPGRLRLVWGTQHTAAGPVARFGANAVGLQIASWDEDLTAYAASSRERGVGAFPYVEQVFHTPRSSWPAGWAAVERWSKPLADAGILWGYHVSDEWANQGLPQGVRDEAVAFVRGKGFEVLNTEWVDAVLHRDYRRPQGRWFGVNCYAYGSRTPWTTQGCVETFSRHPEWNLVVVPAFAGGNQAGPYNQAAWEGMADRTGKSIAFWSWDE